MVSVRHTGVHPETESFVSCFSVPFTKGVQVGEEGTYVESSAPSIPEFHGETDVSSQTGNRTVRSTRMDPLSWGEDVEVESSESPMGVRGFCQLKGDQKLHKTIFTFMISFPSDWCRPGLCLRFTILYNTRNSRTSTNIPLLSVDELTSTEPGDTYYDVVCRNRYAFDGIVSNTVVPSDRVD